jgi:hypothetical protein
MMLAAAIQSVLAEAMIGDEAIACWWGARRAELAGRCPLEVASSLVPDRGERLLALARADVADAALADQRAAELERGWADR